MAERESRANTAIERFTPGLEKLRGWESLGREKQDEFLKNNSDLLGFRQMKGMGEFGEMLKLIAQDELIQGTEMDIRDYLKVLYKKNKIRTEQRKYEALRAFTAKLPAKAVNRMASHSLDVLEKFHRIATAALGDIGNALREMPALPATASEKETEAYFEKVEEKLTEHRKNRRKGIPLKKDDELAKKMAANALIHYDEAAGLETSAERRKFGTTVLGWYMDAKAVSGTIRAGRISRPEGVPAVRGRPRKTGQKDE